MSKQANRTMIGVFVLGAVSLLVLSVVVLGSGKFFRKTFSAVCFFEGSVGGLDVGAPVLFNGVRIGSVKGVVLRYDTRAVTTTIPVYIEIDPRQTETVGPRPQSVEKNLSLLIDRGLRARLELQSIITGKLQVALGYYPDKPVRLLGADQKYPEIPTIPMPVQEIAKSIEQLPLKEIINDMATALKGINRVVNSPEITKTIHSVSLTAEEAKDLMQNASSQVQPVSADIRQTLQEAQKVLREINVNVATLASSMDGTVENVQKLVQNIDRQVAPLGPSIQGTLSSIEKTSEEAGMALRQARQTLSVLDGAIGEDSELMYELKNAVKEVGTAAKEIRNLAKALEHQPESLLFGRKKK